MVLQDGTHQHFFPPLRLLNVFRWSSLFSLGGAWLLTSYRSSRPSLFAYKTRRGRVAFSTGEKEEETSQREIKKKKNEKEFSSSSFFHSRWPRDGPISGVLAAAASVVVVKNKPKGEPFLCCLFSRPAAVAHVTIDATVDDDNAQAKRRRQQQQPSQTFSKQTCRRRSFIHSLSVCPFVFRFVSPASSGIFLSYRRIDCAVPKSIFRLEQQQLENSPVNNLGGTTSANDLLLLLCL